MCCGPKKWIRLIHGRAAQNIANTASTQTLVYGHHHHRIGWLDEMWAGVTHDSGCTYTNVNENRYIFWILSSRTTWNEKSIASNFGRHRCPIYLFAKNILLRGRWDDNTWSRVQKSRGRKAEILMVSASSSSLSREKSMERADCSTRICCRACGRVLVADAVDNNVIFPILHWAEYELNWKVDVNFTQIIIA